VWQPFRLGASVRKKWSVLIVPGALLAVLLLYPFETTVVPEWKVRVVDESGKPMISIGVKEGWEHSSIEMNRHEQDLTTDNDGWVTFPRRTIRANLLWRLGGAFVTVLPHAQSGPHFFLDVQGPYSSLTGSAYLPGDPLPGTLVVRRLDGPPLILRSVDERDRCFRADGQLQLRR
jgi:hypothetical protein